MKRVVLFVKLTLKGGFTDGGYVFTISDRVKTITITYMDGNVKNYEFDDVEDIELELREYPS